MEKIKLFIQSEKGKNFWIILIIIFISISSFGLGRLSKQSDNNSFKIVYSDQKANLLSSISENEALKDLDLSIPQNNRENSRGEYFASNRGKKYYPVDCSAGKSIKVENRIYFKTVSEAEKAGYELSSSCN